MNYIFIAGIILFGLSCVLYDNCGRKAALDKKEKIEEELSSYFDHMVGHVINHVMRYSGYFSIEYENCCTRIFREKNGYFVEPSAHTQGPRVICSEATLLEVKASQRRERGKDFYRYTFITDCGIFYVNKEC